MKYLHVICKGGCNLKRITQNVFDSGYWPVNEDDAGLLVGGVLCLHETKSSKSYFGGVVMSFREAGIEHPQSPKRKVFTIQPTIEARGQRWRGENAAMVWVGGVVDDEG